jgi:hypothetical protein
VETSGEVRSSATSRVRGEYQSPARVASGQSDPQGPRKRKGGLVSASTHPLGPSREAGCAREIGAQDCARLRERTTVGVAPNERG